MSDLGRCRTDLFERGQNVFVMSQLPAEAVQALVDRVKKDTGNNDIDWGYMAGRATVLMFGDEKQRADVRRRLAMYMPQWYAVGEKGEPITDRWQL